MPSIADYYQGPDPRAAQRLPFELATIGLQEGAARSDASLAESRNQQLYSRNLPDLVNAYSAKGTVRGGQAGVAADRLRADYDWQQATVKGRLNRQIADFQRNRILSTIGTMI